MKNYRAIYEEIDRRFLDVSRRALSPRAEALAEALTGCTDTALLEELGKRERERILGRCKLSSLGTALSSAGYYRLFRPLENEDTILKATDGKYKHAFIAGCSLTLEEWEARNESTNKIDRLTNPTEIDPNEAIATAAKLIESQEWQEVAAGLILATGRRPSEVMFAGEFEAIDSDYHAMFTGQLKKRGEGKPFTIATLLPVKDVRSAQARLRKDSHVKAVLKETRKAFPLRGSDEDKYQAHLKRNEEIDKRCNKPINRAVKSELGKTVTARYGESENNCKGLRAAYLAMATKRDCDPNATPGEEMLQAARYAGHFIDGEKPSDSQLRNLITTLGYSDYRVKGAIAMPAVGRSKPEAKARATMRVHPSDLEQFREWEDLWGLDVGDTFARVISLAQQALEQPEQTATTTDEEQVTMPTENARIDALEAKLDKLMMAMATQQQQQPQPVQTAPSVQPQQPKPRQPKREWSTVSRAELFGEETGKPARGTGATEERIERAVEAIEAWNNQFPAGSNADKKWLINNRGIRDLTGAHNAPVAAWLEQYHQRIEDHHAKHELTNAYHNRTNHSAKDGSKTTEEKLREQVYPLIR